MQSPVCWLRAPLLHLSQTLSQSAQPRVSQSSTPGHPCQNCHTPGSQPKSLPLPASGPNSSASTRVTCAQTPEAPWPKSGRAERFCPRGPSPSCGTLGMSGATPWGGRPLLQSWEHSPCLTGHWSAWLQGARLASGPRETPSAHRHLSFKVETVCKLKFQPREIPSPQETPLGR